MATQTKQILLNKKIIFLYIVKINKNLKKIDKKKHCFKRV